MVWLLPCPALPYPTDCPDGVPRPPFDWSSIVDTPNQQGSRFLLHWRKTGGYTDTIFILFCDLVVVVVSTNVSFFPSYEHIMTRYWNNQQSLSRAQTAGELISVLVYLSTPCHCCPTYPALAGRIFDGCSRMLHTHSQSALPKWQNISSMWEATCCYLYIFFSLA